MTASSVHRSSITDDESRITNHKSPSLPHGKRVHAVAGADDGAHSLAAGHIIPQTDPRTIADGLRSSLGDKTFAVLSTRVDAVVTVSEAAIVSAMRLTWEKLKFVVEPSAAVPVAALLEHALPVAGLDVGVILSGGNVDLELLPWQ